MKDQHITALSVRDYECDMQGIVNNSVYMNYLEHARHEFLDALGLSFAEATRKGLMLVVVRAEVDFKSSLASGDKFNVSTSMVPESKLKAAFIQSIHRLADEQLMIKAKIIVAGYDKNGKFFNPADAISHLKQLEKD